MKVMDICALVASKLRIRKLRMVVTVITASILFSVVICVLFVIKGLANSLISSSNIIFGGKTVLAVDYYGGNDDTSEIQEKAVELYEASSDPNKQYPIITPEPDGGFILPPYLDPNNSFAMLATRSYVDERNMHAKAAVGEIARDYGGRAESVVNYYEIDGDSLSIDGLSEYDDSQLGVRSTVVYGSTVEQLTGNFVLKDDLIQVIVSVDDAAKLLQIVKPSGFDADRDAKIMGYIEEVNRRAIGFTFSGTINLAEGGEDVFRESEVAYEIVGLTPSYSPPQSIDYSVNPIDGIIRAFSVSSDISSSFMIANYNSTAFKSSYRLSINNNAYSTRVLTSFSDAEKAYEFSRKYNCGEPGCSPMVITTEFINNKFDLRIVLENTDKLLVAFVVAFSVVAAIIMVGTLSRVIGDERQTIALYRAVGATSRNIIEIYAGYVLVLCLFIIGCSLALGFCFAGVVSFMNSAHVAAFIGEMYNIVQVGSVFLVGWDVRMLFVSVVILVIGLACILLVLDKLLSRDIVKGLRRVE